MHLPNRHYVLYAGPIETALTTLDTGPAELASDPTMQPWDTQSPNLWWPEDKAWSVATEIDYAWTYVGGSERLIEALLAMDGIEVLRTELTAKPFVDSDTINAALDASKPDR